MPLVLDTKVTISGFYHASSWHSKCDRTFNDVDRGCDSSSDCARASFYLLDCDFYSSLFPSCPSLRRHQAYIDQNHRNVLFPSTGRLPSDRTLAIGNCAIGSRGCGLGYHHVCEADCRLVYDRDCHYVLGRRGQQQWQQQQQQRRRRRCLARTYRCHPDCASENGGDAVLESEHADRLANESACDRGDGPLVKDFDCRIVTCL
jgi:hypothetical protein